MTYVFGDTNARWLCGDLTRYCGHRMHDRCKGTIDMAIAQASCLCPCHDGVTMIEFDVTLFGSR